MQCLGPVKVKTKPVILLKSWLGFSEYEGGDGLIYDWAGIHPASGEKVM
jgi:hypothetical protein